MAEIVRNIFKKDVFELSYPFRYQLGTEFTFSSISLMSFKSFLFAFFIAKAMNGANNFENPVGTPLFRKVTMISTI